MYIYVYIYMYLYMNVLNLQHEHAAGEQLGRLTRAACRARQRHGMSTPKHHTLICTGLILRFPQNSFPQTPTIDAETVD